jgi:RNA recognition motif-containing protein
LRKELTDAFSKYGEIKEIVIKTKLGSLNSYAFVEFNIIDEADKALQGYTQNYAD